MTRLWNDPDAFVDEMLAGFVAAHPQHVRRVPGGVVRAAPAPDGEVAVVIGGGSGHYPAFGGLVGTGLAHGAAMGNLFASPSTQQIVAVAEAAERGGGVLFSYGNYAGDVLNFDAAQERLRASGIACETVVVTDDIISAGPADRTKRRGVAGDLAVFRIAASAAEAGLSLEDTASFARRANDRIRSFGIAFSGCTLPGAEQPLFSVPEGRMAVGLGIHGEPGIEETELPSADGLAELLVGRLLEEAPDGPASGLGRVVPILNGLGALKYEELFVVYRRVAQLLTQAGLEIVDPHVGEYCTSFDMAGGSLSLFWLDDELGELWDTAVDSPAYRRRPSTARDVAREPARSTAHAESEMRQSDELPGPSDDASRAAAAVALDALRATAAVLDEQASELGRLDAVAGDGDHGIGMRRGALAALDAAQRASARGAGAGSTLRAAGDAWSDQAGGTSGALWGIILGALADGIGDDGEPAATTVAGAWTSAAAAVMDHGKARPGDKTLVDALVPFASALEAGVGDGASLIDAWASAAAVARSAAAATADLLPRMGRARPHAERSLGTPDPGAHSLALVVTAAAEALAGATSRGKDRR